MPNNSATTNWWWVRHGPTNVGYLAGWTDVQVDLSDTAQIARVSEWLPADAVLISSDLQRASRTADAICGGRRRLSDTESLREICFGEWEGLSHEEISRRFPAEARQYWQDPSKSAPPGGERWQEVSARVSGLVDRLACWYPGGDIVVVAHFGVILTQVQRALGIGFPQLSERPVENLSITRLESCQGEWRMHEFSYLP